MTTKADFPAEEWKQITEAAALAGMAMIGERRGGTVREGLAMAKVYEEAQKQHPPTDLIGALSRSSPDIRTQDFPGKDEMRAETIKRLAEAVALVQARAARSEVEEYRAYVMTIAERTAQAGDAGGFLGIGRGRHADAHRALLDEIAAALGAAR